MENKHQRTKSIRRLTKISFLKRENWFSLKLLCPGKTSIRLVLLLSLTKINHYDQAERVLTKSF